MNDRLKIIGKALLFSFIPLIICVIYAALQGVMLWDINNYAAHLPQYNDGIFYVKQIDAMVKYGMPQGYFGYNESQALVGTLGSWPVFLFYPYVIMGKIFGFSASHMMVFNLVFVMFACLVFCLMAKPTVKQSLFIAAFMLAIPIIPRFILSCMTEALFYAGDILFAGFFAYFAKGNYGRKSVYTAYVLAVFFALCRPYMLIFIVIPAYYHIKINLIEAGVASIGAAGIFAAVYALFVTPRCAKYIEQTIDTYTFTVLKENGIIAFVKELIYKFIKDGKELINITMKEHVEVLVPYRIITILLFMVVLTAVISLIKNKSLKNNEFIAALAVVFITMAVIAALLIFYVEYTSYRHIIVMIVFIVFMAAMYMSNYKIIILAVMALLTWYSYINIGKADMIYKLPTDNNEFGTLPLEEDAQLLENVFAEVPAEDLWDNTLIYQYQCGDEIMNYLHYVPSYMGINLCFEDYIVGNADNLNSKYILTWIGNERTAAVEESGYEAKIVARDYILYQKK